MIAKIVLMQVLSIQCSLKDITRNSDVLSFITQCKDCVGKSVFFNEDYSIKERVFHFSDNSHLHVNCSSSTFKMTCCHH